jgi:hypothetical protein
MRYPVTIFLLALCLSASEADLLDRSLTFKSFDELSIFLRSKECDAMHHQLSELLGSFALVHPPSKLAGMSISEDQMLKVINGMTARQIMLFSLQDKVRCCELAELSDELNIAKQAPLREGESFSQAEPLYKIRIKEAIAYRHLCVSLIKELSTGKSNQTPEPPATGVTAPAALEPQNP